MKRSPQLTELRQNAWASRNPMRVMRAQCLECMGGSSADVDGCTAPECPLYPFRSGRGRRASFDRAMGLLADEGRQDLVKVSKRNRRHETSDPTHDVLTESTPEPTKTTEPIAVPGKDISKRETGPATRALPFGSTR